MPIPFDKSGNGAQLQGLKEIPLVSIGYLNSGWKPAVNARGSFPARSSSKIKEIYFPSILTCFFFFFCTLSSPWCHHSLATQHLHEGVPSLSTLSNTTLEPKFLLSFLLLSLLLIVYFDDLLNAMDFSQEKKNKMQHTVCIQFESSQTS